MIVGPTTQTPAGPIDSARLEALMAAAIAAIEARLGWGEDPRVVVDDVVGAVFTPFGRSLPELARITERLLGLLAPER